MEKRTPEEMANDEKLVEATRAAFKEKELKRVANKKHTLKKIGYALLFTIAAASTFSAIDYFFNQKLVEEATIKIRDQELKEVALIDHLREVKQIKIAQEEKRAAENRRQERIAAEQDHKFKHWLNVLIIAYHKDVKRAKQIMDKVNKPYIEQGVCPYEKTNECVFMITGELEKILQSKGIRYQGVRFEDKKDILEFNKNFQSHVFDVLNAEPFNNW